MKQIFPSIIIAFTSLCLSPTLCSGAPENPIEVGVVAWGRDIEIAFEKSEQTGRPLFVLFQEVPGCEGCQQFGQTVLTNPLLVEAIEDEFIPVLIHNNKSGKDERVLKRFNEPAWNYQVVRFLDSDANDLIPRRERIWTTAALSARMIQSLSAASRPIPKYLEALAVESETSNHATAALAMNCFWTGEAKLGQIDGVISTEAGWLDNREVTRIVYDETVISIEEIADMARSAQCADKIYTPETVPAGLEEFSTGTLSTGYRSAKKSDQKKQIASWSALRKVPDVTEMQRTKINALFSSDRNAAIEWLSPRQLKVLAEAENKSRLDDS